MSKETNPNSVSDEKTNRKLVAKAIDIMAKVAVNHRDKYNLRNVQVKDFGYLLNRYSSFGERWTALMKEAQRKPPKMTVAPEKKSEPVYDERAMFAEMHKQEEKTVCNADESLGSGENPEILDDVVDLTEEFADSFSDSETED
ncbi:MAG: hypothetical protein KAS32_08870, partial [Candidatus Peribacteraceae bacterium]|nr:hypothetical protein [Candidatus Peribacteraceae bacterium]